MIAFVVTAIPAYFLAKIVGDNLDNFKVIGGALLIGGAVMWAVDALFDRPRIVRVADVDTLYQTVCAQGLTPAAVPQHAPWGERYFHVTDPNGHELSFAQRLPAPG